MEKMGKGKFNRLSAYEMAMMMVIKNDPKLIKTHISRVMKMRPHAQKLMFGLAKNKI